MYKCPKTKCRNNVYTVMPPKTGCNKVTGYSYLRYFYPCVFCFHNSKNEKETRWEEKSHQ